MRFSGETETRMKRARGTSHARGVGTPLKINFFLCSSLIALLALRARRAFVQSPVKRTKFTVVCK